MSYVHLTSTCFAEALGSHGLDQTRYELILAKTEDALKTPPRSEGPIITIRYIRALRKIKSNCL